MSGCRVGFYVHHHGRGHANRTREIVAHLRGKAFLFGSNLSVLEDIADQQVVCQLLPPDTSPTASYAEDWPKALHYAPLGVPNIRKRVHTLVGFFEQYRLDLLVVDVSVEVALLARLCSIPTIYSRQHGYRWDAAHTAAFQSADSLLAPYPQSWEEPETPRWIQDKTFYAGGFSRFENQNIPKDDARKTANMPAHQRHVVVMTGFGGEDKPYHLLEETARQNTHWQWWVLGPIPPPNSPPDNLHYLGVQSNPYPYLKGADVVIASAGNNTVMELAELKAHYICIPEARPFDEQLSKARLLARKNAALVLPKWSDPSVWEDQLRQAQQTDTEALYSIIAEGAAQRAAQHIEEIALTKGRKGNLSALTN
ncbi:glycosyltransferase [Tunicatimonas pelagia]|uniref:glycosyltransferase n=1 Tax=Tunicatimonas pelagia TaxID=931531 RepID=UPI00266593F3|nr:glycosyltransferase [Tunicatimonas pelagia]WKN42187.1 glycosyltransferase [Tunicatimonas pelagia]